MENLVIDKTETTLGINFNIENNTLSIIGESRPENCHHFFCPIVEWMTAYRNYLYYKINEFKLSNIKVVVEFKLDYFNSTSAKYILDILLEIEQLKNQNPSLEVVINWYYLTIDEDMKDCGEEFIAMSNLPINLIAS